MAAITEPRRDGVRPWFDSERVTRGLLLCGVAAPLLYALGDAVAGTYWSEYSVRDQTISELAAIGAPSRVIFSAFLMAGYAACAAFGVGVCRAAGDTRTLRIAGAVLCAMGAAALLAVPFTSMRMRGEEQGTAGAIHLATGMVFMSLLLLTMLLAAVSLRRRFRIYTITTIAVMLAFGVWAGVDGSRLAEGLETPWLGVKERISVYAYQAWIGVLAIVVMRAPR